MHLLLALIGVGVFYLQLREICGIVVYRIKECGDKNRRK